MTPKELHDSALDRARRALVGVDDIFASLLAALVVGGNVLIEGVPGTAKTLMGRVIAGLFGAGEVRHSDIPIKPFQRIQFTPDLMPSDILGTNIFNIATTS